MVELTNAVMEMTESGKTQAEIKSYLKNKAWIGMVSETPDGGLTCRTSFGVTAVWTPQKDGYISAPSHSYISDIPALYSQTDIGHNKNDAYDVKKIVLLCPFASVDSSFNLAGYNYIGEGMKKYTQSTLTILKDSEVSLAALKKLNDYDMVWFYSHGALSNITNSAWAILDSDPYTMTGEFASSPAAYILLSEDFFYGRTIVSLNDGRIGVGGRFYEYYYSDTQLKDTFFHFASCNSMRTTKLADGILSRGAAWVEGWTDSVLFNNDYMQFVSVIGKLCEGETIQDSIAFSDNYVREHYDFWQNDCKLVGRGNVNYRIASTVGMGQQSEIHFYEFFDSVASTWEAAQAYCESLGGHLAALTSQEENDYVYQKMVDAGYKSAYFGLTDSDTEGTWRWVTGEPTTYQNWHSGEPNAENQNEDYAMFYYKYSDGTWNDGDFGGKTVNSGKVFICEWDTKSAYDAYCSRKDQTDTNKPWKNAYMQTLRGYPEFETQSWGKEYLEYTLYDIDKNGVPELIVKHPVWNYDIYTYNGENSVSCGEISDSCFGSYAELYQYQRNGIVIHGGGMGIDRVEYIYVQPLVNNKLSESSFIASTENITFSELYSTLKSYAPLNDFYRINDSTPLEE